MRSFLQWFDPTGFGAQIALCLLLATGPGVLLAYEQHMAARNVERIWRSLGWFIAVFLLAFQLAALPIIWRALAVWPKAQYGTAVHIADAVAIVLVGYALILANYASRLRLLPGRPRPTVLRLAMATYALAVLYAALVVADTACMYAGVERPTMAQKSVVYMLLAGVICVMLLAYTGYAAIKWLRRDPWYVTMQYVGVSLSPFVPLGPDGELLCHKK